MKSMIQSSLYDTPANMQIAESLGNGDRAGIRTLDLLIKRPLRYRAKNKTERSVSANKLYHRFIRYTHAKPHKSVMRPCPYDTDRGAA